jgi:hypothetical protein
MSAGAVVSLLAGGEGASPADNFLQKQQKTTQVLVVEDHGGRLVDAIAFGSEQHPEGERLL